MLTQTVFLIFNLSVLYFCSDLFLNLSAQGGGTATSAAAVGTFRGHVSCPSSVPLIRGCTGLDFLSLSFFSSGVPPHLE